LKTGASCSFEKAPNQQVFSILVEYADAPDADAVTTWLKVIETRTYEKPVRHRTSGTPPITRSYRQSVCTENTDRLRCRDNAAAAHLATMYHEGLGGPVNDYAAQALFTKAADAGYVPAMVPLAFLYAAKPDFVSISGWWVGGSADGEFLQRPEPELIAECDTR
jgi:TPR repeat protein